MWAEKLEDPDVRAIYCNHDYEPYARRRDSEVARLCRQKERGFFSHKDHVIFEHEEIKSDKGSPYTIYTPYKKKWLANLGSADLVGVPRHCASEKLFAHLNPCRAPTALPSLAEIGFVATEFIYPDIAVSDKVLRSYARTRDFPAHERGTSHLGLHLRFGTISIREAARQAKTLSEVWMSELIWREFFMQILWYHPRVVDESFRPEFERVAWRYEDSELERWQSGQTGYPFVDAGLRELNATGYMHNRARMVTASFLTKHLLHHWREGEAYFAKHLLDYELASNNGNWQWAAGTGCDAAPYFRIFNPLAQAERFDPEQDYIRKWIPEIGTAQYPPPMVVHEVARSRALAAFAVVKAAKKEKIQ